MDIIEDTNNWATYIGWFIMVSVTIVGLACVIWGAASKSAHHSTTQMAMIFGVSLITISWTIFGAITGLTSFLAWVSSFFK